MAASRPPLPTGPLAALVAGIAGVALGAGANVATWEPPGPLPPCPVVEDPVPQPRPVPRRREVDAPAPPPIAALTPDELAVHLELVATVGTSTGWPDDVPAAYRPEGVAAAVAAAVAACPELEDADIQLDCDEYPCRAWGFEPEGTRTWSALWGCRAWTYPQAMTTFLSSDATQFCAQDVRFRDDGFDEDDLEVRRRYRVETWTPVVLEAWDQPWHGYR